MNTPDLDTFHAVAVYEDRCIFIAPFWDFDEGMCHYANTVKETNDRVVYFPVEHEKFQSSKLMVKAREMAANETFVAHAQRDAIYTFTNVPVNVNALSHFTTRELLEELLERQMP